MRPVLNWLVTGCVMIGGMVLIGGVTRLTGSGLSITEWKPIVGAVPPLNGEQWKEAFAKYQGIPEYKLVNSHMDLAGFKRIFFWEYLHRNWGRLMGLVFLVPFLWFWRTGRLNGPLMRRTLTILIGGGLVGALGWFMVASGLEDMPDVSHYRLAIHLVSAFTVFSLVLWTAFDVKRGRRTYGPGDDAVGRQARWLLLLLLVQVVYGAFTAGLDAGRIYNTWPLMNGRFIPDNVLAFPSLWKDLTDHRDGVQFVHRNLAWLVAVGFLAVAWMHRGRKDLSSAMKWLAVAVVVQFALGILTVLTQVDLVLGVLHQSGALLLLVALLNVVHRTGRPLPSAA